jgi:amino acid adenylation domain-containing protein
MEIEYHGGAMHQASTAPANNSRTGVTVLDLFEKAAAENPDEIAVEFENQEIPYSGLRGWAAAVGAALWSRGVRPGDRVALGLPPGPEAVAAILGIARTGAAYVPLDLRNPRRRNDLIITDSAATALIGDAGSCSAPPAVVFGTRDIARLRDTPVPGHRPQPARHTPAGDLYVIYTSGTTGRPKGVPVTHAALAALLAGTSELFSFSSRDRWLLFHSLAFDFAVWELWGPLTTGARLVVLPPGVAMSAEDTARTVAGKRITVLNQTPTAFGSFSAAALRAGTAFPDLRYIVFGGEKLVPDLLRPWVQRHGAARPHLINMYGITETTVHSTFHAVTEDDLRTDESRIGHPLPGFDVRVCDAGGAAVPYGQVGELWLAGPQVASGYLNRPALTAERFAVVDGHAGRYYRSGDLVRQERDGSLTYHGRADLQVKLRGHRIELGEIEATVRGHERVADAVAWVHEHSPGDQRLICAFTTTTGSAPEDPRTLAEYVKGRLPSYLRPAHYLHLAALPRTVNGKIDRGALGALMPDFTPLDAPGRPAPTGRTGEYLAALWSELLGVTPIADDDNFFELGGHSLLAFRMQMRIGRDLGPRIPFAEFVANPVLSALTRVVDHHSGKTA